ncbi:hypothetical protein PCASD_18071 [Puccinia coronata f. sp. avenae]|uniref:Uncharacterized protein n=1 Tax=Puccinia coronata f. sp. avenae TaxID=200324 RepID=A0A2N5U0H6_9BASI|nr:hypothetical protein PCASD_18071 [Puccinia coronata f. sp. avenae]
MSSCKPPTANGGLGMTALDTLYHALIHVHHPHSYASLTGDMNPTTQVSALLIEQPAVPLDHPLTFCPSDQPVDHE